MKKENLLFIFLMLFVTLTVNSCDKKKPNCPDGTHNGITIVNQSTRVINPHFYGNYPDTTIGEYNPLNDGTNGTIPGESYVRGAGRNSCWESQLKDGNKEWIHFFDNDSLKVIPWDTVRATGRGLLERRMIDLEYLKANNFTVVYK